MTSSSGSDEDEPLRRAADEARRSTDPRRRQQLARAAIRMLEAGEPLPPVMREWLVFVLRELVERDRVPHQARGRPSDPLRASMRATAVAQAFLELNAARPGMLYDEMSEAIALRLEGVPGMAMSAATVKALRESPSFREHVEHVRLCRAAGIDPVGGGVLLRPRTRTR